MGSSAWLAYGGELRYGYTGQIQNKGSGWSQERCKECKAPTTGIWQPALLRSQGSEMGRYETEISRWQASAKQPSAASGFAVDCVGEGPDGEQGEGGEMEEFDCGRLRGRVNLAGGGVGVVVVGSSAMGLESKSFLGMNGI